MFRLQACCVGTEIDHGDLELSFHLWRFFPYLKKIMYFQSIVHTLANTD